MDWQVETYGTDALAKAFGYRVVRRTCGAREEFAEVAEEFPVDFNYEGDQWRAWEQANAAAKRLNGGAQ